MVKARRRNRRYQSGLLRSAFGSADGGRPHKITNEEKFREFIQENDDKTQKQMAELWGDNVTQQNISYFCQKLGITRKSECVVLGFPQNVRRTQDKNLWLSRER